ncbi:putative sodium-independent sulfate anion transporter [Apostichopus japonicus]|uniref:Putative sodium-independent sulfate anion transporter n=1 Tax=Stichopus japonicus TaxID=307972 RepID=A0A2G8K0L3_STIJA|nr:putative sodium-independent sulfate anion transporter [Apostichopus japonicus]
METSKNGVVGVRGRFRARESAQSSADHGRNPWLLLEKGVEEKVSNQYLVATILLQLHTRDVIAGLTVALTVIPQSLAYASIAKLHIQYGLYSAFMGCFVYCLFGTSKDITVGPTAILSLLVATYGYPDKHDPTINDAQLAIILAFLCGIIQFIMGVFHLGSLIGFISAPVISGFTSASALSIAMGQVKHLLGISFSSETFLETAEGIIKNIKHTKKYKWILLYGCQVRSKKRQAASKYSEGSFGLLGQELNVGLLVVPLIAYLETIAIGKAFARQNRYKIEPNQEMIAVGLCNIAGSFFSSYPVTGSFSRTAINSQSGVKTPLGGVITGALVVTAILCLTPAVQYIPKAALAAMIIVAVLKMFNCKIFLTLWRVNKIDLVPLCVTFICSLLLGVQYGTIIGICIDLVILQYPVARPSLKSLNSTIVPDEESPFLPKERSSPLIQVDSSSACIVQVDRSVRYPAADYLVDRLNEIRETDSFRQHVIFDFKHVIEIDYTFIESLSDAIADFSKAQAKLLLVNVKLNIHDMLHRAQIPGLEIYPSIDEAVQSLSAMG